MLAALSDAALIAITGVTLVVGVLLWALPYEIARRRGHRQLALVGVLALLGPLLFGVPWLAALVLACSGPRCRRTVCSRCGLWHSVPLAVRVARCPQCGHESAAWPAA